MSAEKAARSASKKLQTGKNPWTQLSTRIAYENPWIRIHEDDVIRPDGKQGIYGVVEIRPSIGVVALNEKDEIVLAGQWRYALNRYTWEIPRGGSSDGESDMLAVAKRELQEEVGIDARTWHSLGAVDICSGVSTDVQHLFLATELSHVGADQEPVEEIVTEWIPFEQAVHMAMDGSITDVCSIAGLLKVNQIRKDGKINAVFSGK